MSPIAWLAIIITAVALITLAVERVTRRPKRPKPQQPPHDIGDRERFNAIKRDWEQKP